MKLSEFKDDEALEVLADLIEPATKILTDKEVVSLMQGNSLLVTIAAKAIKNQKKAVVEMLAAMHRVPVEDYHFNILTLTVDLLDVLNDRELIDFFRSQGKKTETTSSGSATENTGENVQ